MKTKTYTVEQIESGTILTKQTIDQVVELIGVAKEDIEWVIEECGEVSTDEYKVEEDA